MAGRDPGSGRQYGSNLHFMRRLVERWRDDFDWRAQEAKLNAFDQFRVPIEGIDLHFVATPGPTTVATSSARSTSTRS